MDDSCSGSKSLNNPIESGSSGFCAGLAARRAANLPKLSTLTHSNNNNNNNNNNNQDMKDSCRNSTEGVDGYEIDADVLFTYSDSDDIVGELAELYTYSEIDEFVDNANAFYRIAGQFRWEGTFDVNGKMKPRAKNTIDLLMDRCELSDKSKRMEAVRGLLYLLQGNFMDFGTVNGENNDCSSELQAIIDSAVCNAKAIYQLSGFSCLCTCLSLESEACIKQNQEEAQRNEATEQTKRKSFSMQDNTDIRLVLNALYILTECMRHIGEQAKTEQDVILYNNFKDDLGTALVGDELLSVHLFELLNVFCTYSAPQLPVRKIAQLLWKTLLVWMGGMDFLRAEKAGKRAERGLSVAEDTLDIAMRMEPAPPPIMQALYASVQQTRYNSQNNNETSDESQGARRPPLARRQLACVGLSEEDELTIDEKDTQSNNEDDHAFMETVVETVANADIVSSAAPRDTNGNVAIGDTPRPGSPTTPTGAPEDGFGPDRSLVQAKVVLPWKPKIRPADLNMFLEHERKKFFGFTLEDDFTTTTGLPRPILESLQALKKHSYISLAEIQAEKDDDYNKYFFSQKEDEIEETPAEILYSKLQPRMPQHIIAMLKVLLAAAPSSKAKTEAINILTDVLPADTQLPASTSSNQVDELNMGQSNTSIYGENNPIRVVMDVNRHKEVLVKSLSSIILLVLKHFKLNHIYQMEFVSQHLVFANCIPLILKFFDQNVASYIGSRNELHDWNYPYCVYVYACRHKSGETINPERWWPDIRSDNLDRDITSTAYGKWRANEGPGRGFVGQYFQWRNLYSCVNLLRILNKLTKWKHQRTMMMVVFKRLTDDWAYGNETQSKPWDFQSEEAALRNAIEKFNVRRYGKESLSGSAMSLEAGLMDGCDDRNSARELEIFQDPEYIPYDTNIVSVLGVQYELTDRFKRNYEKWLHREVYKDSVDWDRLLALNSTQFM